MFHLSLLTYPSAAVQHEMNSYCIPQPATEPPCVVHSKPRHTLQQCADSVTWALPCLELYPRDTLQVATQPLLLWPSSPDVSFGVARTHLSSCGIEGCMGVVPAPLAHPAHHEDGTSVSTVAGCPEATPSRA